MAPSSSKKSTKLLLSVIIILTLLLCLGCYGIYHYQEKNITIEKHEELAAIGKLKVDQLVNWRRKRLENSRSIFNNQMVKNHISEYIHGVNPYANYLTITKWIKTILDEPDYSMAVVTDPSGKIILNTNPAKTLTEKDKHIIEQAILNKSIVFSDSLKYNAVNDNIDLAIPLYLNHGANEGLTGVVFLRIDPEKFLYPLILNWPTPSRSSEIMLVRRDGDSVLILSGMQHENNKIYRLHKSLTDRHIIAIQAIAGKAGMLESIDYRGIKVLGDAHAVPNSPWNVVTKVDIDEFYHPVFILVIWIFVITFLFILITILIVWKQQLKESEQERKLAVEKLRASEESFRALAESLPQFVWSAQADGMAIYFNQRWTEYTWLTLEESYGTGWITPYHPDDRQLAWNAWQHALENGENFNIECRLRRYDGEYHWFVIMGVPMRDCLGDITKWHGTYTDIENQKQVVSEVKNLNEELEHRVAERTFQLQTANKEMEAFSYSVSHDLRAPLQNIDGWSKILFENCYDQLDLQCRQYLDHVISETQRMGNLIGALLNLSRVSRTELTKSNVDLSNLAQDISHRLIIEPSARQVEFIIQPGIFTLGDFHLLEIALTNLLDNAYKYTGQQAHAQIEFGKSIINKKPTYWVKDNGIGFDMKNAKNLFGAFQRMHKQSDFPGTGIGLATVQRIIHRHDGHIWAESKMNEGTTFYFTILL